MYWFGFGNKKGRGKKVQPHNKGERYKSNVVVAALTDWMVARGSVKDSK
tara:strand:+ start:337 stop:483 length:147 start_codon:yes stop_codon:yes gene_type:complete